MINANDNSGMMNRIVDAVGAQVQLAGAIVVRAGGDEADRADHPARHGDGPLRAQQQ